MTTATTAIAAWAREEGVGMTVWWRVALLAAGLLAGLVATLVMIPAMAAGCTWLGISSQPEAIPDRFALTLDSEA